MIYWTILLASNMAEGCREEKDRGEFWYWRIPVVDKKSPKSGRSLLPEVEF